MSNTSKNCILIYPLSLILALGIYAQVKPSMIIVYLLLSIPGILQYLFLLGFLCLLPYAVLTSIYSFLVRKIQARESLKVVGLVGCATLTNMSILHAVLLLFQDFD